MTWIRLRLNDKTHHAVIAVRDGEYITYCDRHVPMGVPVTATAGSRCQTCRSRIDKPWRLPLHLAQLKNQKAEGAGA